MPETHEYLIKKALEPEQLGQAYVDSLQRLPGEEEDLTPGLHVRLKLRKMTPEQARMVEARAHIESVEPNHVASVPTPVEVQTARNMSPSEARAYHGIDEAHRRGVKGKGQKIGIIDSGCGEAFAASLGGRIVEKVSWISGETWESPDDAHGEWVLSAIAYGLPEAVYGILKGLSGETGSGSYSGIIAAVNHAVKNGYTGINLSLGGPASSALDAAVAAARDAGLCVTVSAGNGQRNSTDYTADNQSPARSRRVLTIAAVGSDDVPGEFSSWGTCVDLAALGVRVGAEEVARYWNGTSMSAPYAAVGVALVRSAGATLDRAEQAILATARNTVREPHKEGQGVMDVRAALDSLAPAPAPKPEPAPAPAPEEPKPAPKTMSRWAYAKARPKDLNRELTVTFAGKPIHHLTPVEPYPYQ